MDPDASPLGRIPHRPPFVLIDRVISASTDEAVSEKLVSADDPWLRGGMPPLLLVEALAQTAACMVEASEGGIGHQGRLVAATGFAFDVRAAVGDRVTFRVQRTARLGALVRVSGTAHVGEQSLTSGELTLAVVAA